MSEAAGTAQEAAATPVVNETAAPDPWAAFPAEFNWVRKELEDTRKEAADKRVLARELQDKLATAKTPEEVQQITAAYDTKTNDLEVALARERVARKTGLSDELVEFLTGKSEEELTAQAEKLAGLKPAADGPVVVTVQEPRGGLDPSHTPIASNGYDAWEDYKKNRH
ncbi:MAG TPA: hypothetical protein VF885_00275 [Arthrobacter sp.]